MNPTRICKTRTTHPRHAGKDFAVVPAIIDTAVMTVSGVYLRMNKKIGMQLLCSR